LLDCEARLATHPVGGSEVAPARGREQTLDIVIYEEDLLTRNLLREWMEEAGYAVHRGALNEARRKCRADLVIASVFMPKQSRTGWLRDIQAAHPGIPVIAISGQFRPGLCADGATAETLGVQQVIAKPLIRADLLAAICAMIGRPL
jgi:DNA-binding response OmpR family regulator